MEPVNRKEWRNWGRNVRATPEQWLTPERVEEVQAAVRSAKDSGKRLRVVGAGHSFSPVAQPKEILMSLERLRGILAFDEDAMEVKIAAGTPLWQVGPALLPRGVALANMGDVHAQSLAGATCTGTHGTGIDLPSLAASVVAWEYVDGNGELREHRRGDDDRSLALHLSLGLLGVFVSLTIKVVPLYGLLERSERMNFDQGLTQFRQKIGDVRHMEWFLFPGSKLIQQKTLERVEPEPLSWKEKLSDRFESIVMLNGLYYLLSELVRFFPSTTRWASQVSARGIPNTTRRGYSYEVFPKPRGVRFVETEYFVPLEHHQEILTRCHSGLMQDQRGSHFPIEVRVQPGEPGFLSPTQGQDSLVLSFHVYKGICHSRYFHWVRDLMAEYQGRPHWGKVSLLSHEDNRALYPDLDRFLAQREQCDPERVFVTPYFAERILGESV